MLIRKLALFATLLAIAVAGPTSGASAVTFLKTDPGGNVIAPGTLLASTNGQMSLTSALGNMNCTASFAADAIVGGTTPVVPLTLTGFTLSACSDTIPSINFDDCTTVTPLPTVTATGVSSNDGSVTIANNYLRCHAIGSGTPGFACYLFSALATGTFTNTNSTLTYAGVATTSTAPPGATDSLGAFCPSTSSLSMDLPAVHRATLDTVTTTVTVTTTGVVTATTTVPTQKPITVDTNLGSLTVKPNF